MGAESGTPERGKFWRLMREVGVFLAFSARLVVALFCLAVLVGLWFLFTGGPAPSVPDRAMLVWAPQGDLTEQPGDDDTLPLARSFFGGKPDHTRLANLVTVLDRAAGDDRIKLVRLKLDDMGHGGVAQLQELAEAIRRFRKSGKPVIATSYRYDQGQYVLAAQAQKIYLDPMGDVLLKGFGFYNYYFGKALGELGIQAYVFRVGKYKSAVEPFVRDNMSAAAREESRALLTALWNTYKQEITAGRPLMPESIDDFVSRYGDRIAAERGDAARTALKAGLVDNLATAEELSSEPALLSGPGVDAEPHRQIDDRDYLAATNAEQTGHPPKTIGLVVVSGAIVEGRNLPGMAGADTLAGLIEQGRKDKDIAALVVRINSPGGGMDAAEKIRRQLVLTREQGKPIVVSMADVAASGGYWIAANADQIYAEDATITGSIGIFSIQPSIVPLLEKLGIGVDGVGTTPLADARRADRPLSPEVSRIIQMEVDHAYERFVQLVAEGRHLSPETVERIAGGRVWSGRDAQRLGLVDRIGGLEAAARAAAQLARLKPGEYRLTPIAEPSGPIKSFNEWFPYPGKQSLRDGMRSIPFARSVLRRVADMNFVWMNDPRGIYAYCPCIPDTAAAMR
jgi:protease-4